MRKNFFKMSLFIFGVLFITPLLNSCKDDGPTKKPVEPVIPEVKIPDPPKPKEPNAEKEFPLLDLKATEDMINEYEKDAGRKLEKNIYLQYFKKEVPLYINNDLPTITAVVYNAKFSEEVIGIMAFSKEPFENAPRTIEMIKKAGFGEGQKRVLSNVFTVIEWVGKGVRIRFAPIPPEKDIQAKSFLIITPYEKSTPDTGTENPDTGEVYTGKPVIVFETELTGGVLKMVFDADEADKDDIWVDLNNDGKKQENEKIEIFLDYKDYPVQAQKIKVYGKLIGFGCRDSKVTKIDVTNAPDLEQLSCVQNKITSLDLSKNPLLTILSCYENNLEALDVSNNPKLTNLLCFDNPISVLDVSKNKELKKLQCYKNGLSSIELSNNTNLRDLICSSNKLTSLDLSNNKKLESLDISHNEIEQLDLTNNGDLIQIYCGDNKLSSLNISHMPMLMNLFCNGNSFKEFDFSNNTEISDLRIYNNEITEEKMKLLLESLPKRSANDRGMIMIIDSSLGDKEHNKYPSNTKSICDSKIWEVYDYKGGENGGKNAIK